MRLSCRGTGRSMPGKILSQASVPRMRSTYGILRRFNHLSMPPSALILRKVVKAGLTADGRMGKTCRDEIPAGLLLLGRF